MAEEDNQQEETFKPKNVAPKSPLVLIFLIINFVFMGVIAYMQFVGHQKVANTPTVQEIVKSEMNKVLGEEDDSMGEGVKDNGINYPLDGFTANLAQGDGPRRYLRMNAVLKFSTESEEEEFKARKAQIRDAVISIINAKRPEDLMKLEGKKFLKEEIKSSINTFLVAGQVIDVYYTSFQIK